MLETAGDQGEGCGVVLGSAMDRMRWEKDDKGERDSLRGVKREVFKAKGLLV